MLICYRVWLELKLAKNKSLFKRLKESYKPVTGDEVGETPPVVMVVVREVVVFPLGGSVE